MADHLYCRATLRGRIWWNSTTWVSPAAVPPIMLHSPEHQGGQNHC